MKQLTLALIVILFYSCKVNEKNTTPKKDFITAQKIANAHGFKQWDKVKTFQFTFGGKIDETNSGRAWTWNPKTDDVQMVSKGETLKYNRSSMDSTAIKADRSFINDKFWTLIPFQLIWDKGATISAPEKARSPIKDQALSKITITYSNEGGYTPGDAYDIFYDDNYIIQEWIFRRDNAAEPSLTNTFENYTNFRGIKIAQEHKKSEGDWNLLVRNLKVEFID